MGGNARQRQADTRGFHGEQGGAALCMAEVTCLAPDPVQLHMEICAQSGEFHFNESVGTFETVQRKVEEG